MGRRGRGSTEWQRSGTRSGTGRFVPAGSGSDAPEYAHSLHSTVEGAHRAGSRLRTIPRRSVIGRSGKIKTIEELVSDSEKISVSSITVNLPEPACHRRRGDRIRWLDATASFEERRSTMSQRTLRISVLATLLLFTGGVSAQADEIFTVRIENVSAKDALKLSNGKTEPVGVAPVLYV